MDGGLNNLAYVIDPNQWVDIEGLNPRRVQSPANQPQLINYNATSIINQIRQYNPQFSYSTISPSYTSARYNRRDIENLNAILKNYQSQKTCLPNSYWVNYNTNRPARDNYATPGTRTVNILKPSSAAGNPVYQHTTHFDAFGREVGQTHRTTNGRPDNHSNPHHHRYDIHGNKLRAPNGSLTWPGLFGAE